MKTFSEYQSAATRIPVCPDARNISLPVLGLQEEAGKIGKLIAIGTTSGKLALTIEQVSELRIRFGDILWYVAILCKEAGIQMQDVAENSVAELEKRFREIGSSE